MENLFVSVSNKPLGSDGNNDTAQPYQAPYYGTSRTDLSNPTPRSDTLVTSPISYHDQQHQENENEKEQQQQSIPSIATTSPTASTGAPRSGHLNYNSFQFHYNPFGTLGEGEATDTYPPPRAPSPSSASQPPTNASEDNDGANTTYHSPTKSAVSISAARETLRSQQRYQKQRDEQFMSLRPSYSSNSITSDVWTQTATASTSTTPICDSTIEPLKGPYNETVSTSAAPASTPIGPTVFIQDSTLLEKALPSLPTTPGLTPPPLAPRPATSLYTTLDRNSYLVGQIDAVPPASPHNGLTRETEPYNPTMTTTTTPTINRGRAASIQFGESPKREGHQTQGTLSPPSSPSYQSGTSLTRARTVSSANTALNANFFSHHVPKAPRKNAALAAAMAAATGAPLPPPESSHIADGPGPVVLVAIGKTGQGKSSLLNRIMGTNELKASASVRAVTKGIAERSGWARFEDNRRFLVTVADTPGLADTEGDDEKNIPILKDYIHSIGSRLGVSAFLLVFKINSSVDIIMTILKTFNDIMQEFPYVWENVILVFTGCDFKRDREILEAKQLMTTVLQQQIREHILKKLPNRPAAVNGSSTNKSTGGSTSRSTTMASFNSSSSTSSSSSSPSVSTSNSFTKPRSATTYSPSLSPVSDFDDDTVPSIPMVFLTTAENICSFALGAGKCDCDKHSDYLKVTMKRLWNEVRKTKRWVIHGDNEDDFINHS